MPAPSEADAPAWPADAVEVGRVSGAWGVKGALRVSPHADSPAALLAAREWFLRPPADPRVGVRPVVLKVTQARRHGEGIVASVAGIADRDAAEALRGAAVFVSRASFPAPAPGEYYWVDLIGLDVVDRRGSRIGVVHGLMDLGPHAVLQVRPPPPGRGEVLIPFVAAYVDEVDLAARRVTVDWDAEA